MSNTNIKPDYLFEVSWEVCNKVGGIHTVVATKSVSIKEKMGDNFILIGPDLVRDEGDNSEFEPDEHLFKEWREEAGKEGFRIKVGRWKIPSRPVAILMDFSDFFQQKDYVFSRLWEDYKLDSISGQWDYIEPALFGYASGKLIESFIKFNLSPRDKAVAQFHEWMTGAGVLYLKKNLPQVATAFTTHATVIGRCIAGNNRPLYSKLKSYNPDEVAKEFNILSKQSLEKITAQVADVFTTVSDITANECQQFLGRDVDIVTPNGFEDTIIPTDIELNLKREEARAKMLTIASSLVAEKLPEDTYIIATSGRYEYKNKGLDIFINSLKQLQESDKLDRPILAFFLVPAHHYGARKELQTALAKNEVCECGLRYMTHYLHDPEWDPILKSLKKYNLINTSNDKVKVVFVPSYLNGNDGLFNLPYYDILMGCDQTVFPSYYEPWGYTPLESLAFSVPTITTSLAGFGIWARNNTDVQSGAITVIERTDDNDYDVAVEIKDAILKNYKIKGKNDIEELRKESLKSSQIALWRVLVENYNQAYSIALDRSLARSDQFVPIEEKQIARKYEEIRPLSNQPQWKRIIVKSKLPKSLSRLTEIMENIWWTWDDEAQELFETIDPAVWRLSDYNPYIILEQVSFKRIAQLSKDSNYIAKLDSVYSRLKQYLEGEKELSQPKIAYFSMEFGFHDCLKLYSGGLGILAGDYLKEASDAKVNIVGIGLLYRYGYFSQVLTNKGEQQANYDYQHFSKLPIHPVRDENGDFVTISVTLPGRSIYARIWYIKVGRIILYLLDSDFENNAVEDRGVSHQLYGGDNENRLKQELLLGVGGIRALNTLGITPDLYHSNEGHSAFIGLERIRTLMREEQLTFSEAKEIVRSTTLFTTHTPVPAGHDHFDEDLLRKYMGHYPDRIRISWEEFMALGRSNPNDWSEKFNMSYLAAHLAQEVNGVSMLHGEVTKDMFVNLWPGFLPQELHVNYVTNGVHWNTWTSSAWKKVYQEMFDGNFVDEQLDFEKWNRIYDIDDKRVWNIKQSLRTRLIHAIKERYKENWIKRHEDPRHLTAIQHSLSDKVLTVVFARRFATYKRAHLLFKNPDRLSKLINNPDRPIQFIFAGKAHPRDKAGQDLIKYIVDISKRPEFIGKIIFLQNYSIGLAKLLVSGADIWLNTPTRPLEASGTSGEKAVMNGTMHFSVLDGWWVEGYKPDAGWALTNERTYENQEFQDDLDAEVIYSLFENDILPAFYNRDAEGIPHEWVSFIKNTIAKVSPHFTTRRMITDYIDRFYNKQFKRSAELLKDDYQKIKELATWKKQMMHMWGKMEVLDMKLLEKNTQSIETGSVYHGEVVLRLNDIPHENVGVELVISEGFSELVDRMDFKLVKFDETTAIYELEASMERPGTFQYGVRVFPKHELLPHRQDFGMLYWI
ncbi:MAG: alpha-glucan family phosphorylase [Bacteroidales bacterium]|nr:alpha-glucan family phosphorylase [Bacteroidales bacterium]MBN2818761.1 alpha-glucan family phosphorylase [Bacteroidales bacterium]